MYHRLERLWKAELANPGPSGASIRRLFIRFVRRRCMLAALLLVLSLGFLLFSVVSGIAELYIAARDAEFRRFVQE